ncbi:Type 1 glutamine amidotransferase-like domain-containing protein (plasmid) [Macrococcus psychrotolerans]|uniref:Type 1 glutamine amidotransferase-like domain-containing protein n=1 Tax=Macrococcus psychrotolerans TaxID=3039389 RepID=A0AAT9P884_9STAP|nr:MULTISPECIES: Type 1 glutamine amidotransferase-like domain-containing protein [Macrococcus]QYA34026.1 Type 1 glutamine amidotransferase-like domain-containing protein [Macrococcus sp. 19Msa1099]QYA38810.1 Type 1 glutamine amidotransferase-like domain-containing protein [Macrococcus caseolyticus]QYA77534.1 Type 1 glutamine amidotransferase-like domain-containing protein [Macrococcus caseolyticus]
MIFFICGGGSSERLKEINKEFASILNRNPKILYLPHAIDENHRTIENSFNYFKDMMRTVNIVDIDICYDIGNTKHNNYDALYIAGGDLKKLSKAIDKNSIEHFIKKNSFKCIYGHSAGAIILGSDILDERNKEKINTWNLIYDHEITCHYYANKEYIALSNKNGRLKLPDNTAVIIQNNTPIKYIGEGIIYKESRNIRN